jgi:hypothetical protein
VWSKTYGGIGNDYAYSVVVTADGGYAIAGWTYSFGTDNYDFWLVKTDEYGNMEWNQTYGGTGYDMAYSLVQTSDGGYAIAGIWNVTFFSIEGTDDLWLVKTDAFGNMEWNQTYEGTGIDAAYSLLQTSDGGYAIAGYTSSFGAGDYDFWLVKTNSTGYMEWNRTYGGSETEDIARSLIVTPDGGYAIVGDADYGAGDSWLVKTDELGNIEWNQTYEESIASVIVTSDGGYAIAGKKLWFVKTDESGAVEWNQTYRREELETATSIVELSDGGYVIAGNKQRPFGDMKAESDLRLFKIDKFGNMEWNQTYGGPDKDERIYSLAATSDGGCILAGYIIAVNGSYYEGDVDAWLVKTDEYGTDPYLVPPEIYIDSPQNRTYNADDISLNFTVDEETTWIRYRLDGQKRVTITGNTTLSGLDDGSHRLVLYANDTDGNVGVSEEIVFTVDTIAPTVSILEPESKTYNVTEVSLNFTVDEPCSEIMYCLDGQANVTISGNTTLTELTNGAHNITVYVTDIAGNTGKSETINFTVAKEVDLTPWIIAVIAIAVIAAVTVFIYYTKRRRKQPA